MGDNPPGRFTTDLFQENPVDFDSFFSPIRYCDGVLELLDQTRLPHEEIWLVCDRPEDVAGAIRRLSVRGAPAIGVAAAYGLALGLKGTTNPRKDLETTASLLAATRPTAVNLQWALDRGVELFNRHFAEGGSSFHDVLLGWARELHLQDARENRIMGDFAVELFAAGDRVLTHCNAGALATAGYGTAIGVITSAHREGRLAQVWVDETRPLLQGARLTAWELEKLSIPYQVVTDNSVGALMARGLVDKVVVGSDRIAANGDAANKIGTYTVAVLAHRHGVPFFVAAPTSTVDMATPSGAGIPIEERDAEEIRQVFGTPITPANAPALNLAFDVTPAELIAAIITEKGILRPPYQDALAACFV